MKSGELRIGKRDVFPDRANGNGKCLTVQVADGDCGAYQDSDSPAQQWPGPRFASACAESPVGLALGFQHGSPHLHEGTRRLVAELRQKFPGVPVCGEMSYDALMSFIPMFHVFQSLGYPAGLEKYTRAFQHMSHPAPGRGSTGAHEYGFGHFDPKTLALNPHQIPTITVVDDTFGRYRDVMAEIIERAGERAGIK